MKHGDDWKLIAEELKLKNKKEAILEFLRTPLEGDNARFLYDSTTNGATMENDLKAVSPYNQADQLFLQCELL